MKKKREQTKFTAQKNISSSGSRILQKKLITKTKYTSSRTEISHLGMSKMNLKN